MIKDNDNKKGLQLSWLKSYLAIVREKSITRAAKELGTSQPTLTKQMYDLEDYLNVTLLIRGKKSVTTTEEGEYFRNKAKEILGLIEQTESALAPTGGIIAGDIYLGSGESYEVDRIVRHFKELKKAYPLLRLHIFSGDEFSVTEKLDSGHIDAGILLNPYMFDRFDYIDLQYSDKFGLLVPKNDPLAQRSSISLEDITNLPLIFSAQTYSDARDKSWQGLDISSLNIVGTYNLINNGTFMVENGLGYALCLSNLVNTENRNLTFVPFVEDTKVPLYLVTKKYKRLSPAAKLFVSYIQAKVEEGK